MFQIVKRVARVARAVFILLYRLVMILWNAGRVGRLAVVIGGFVAFCLVLGLFFPVPAATQTAAVPAPIAVTTPTPIVVEPTPVVVEPTATVEPTPVLVEPTPVVVEPAATELPKAIQEMAAPEVVTPTEAPAPEAAPAPPVSDAPAASDEAAPCAAGQIKGNRNSHIFHAPGQLAYAKTHASVTCFDTAAQATAAGYRAAKR